MVWRTKTVTKFCEITIASSICHFLLLVNKINIIICFVNSWISWWSYSKWPTTFEKANRIEFALLSGMKRAVLQTNKKGHIAGSWLYQYKIMALPLQNLNSEMHFEFDTINNHKECLVNVHAVKNITWTMPWIVKEADLT